MNDNARFAGALNKFASNALSRERLYWKRILFFTSLLSIVVISCILIAYQYKTIEVRHWSELSDERQQELIVQSYAKFPEILQYRGRGKFDRLNEWLASEGVTHNNIRDAFRAYEDTPVVHDGREYYLPGIYSTLYYNMGEIREYLEHPATPESEFNYWLYQVRQNLDYIHDGQDVFKIISQS